MIAPLRAADEEAAFKGLEEWLARLALNGGNYIRVWLSNPFWDVEHEKSGVYDGKNVRLTAFTRSVVVRVGVAGSRR